MGQLYQNSHIFATLVLGYTKLMFKRFIIWFIVAFILITVQAGFFSNNAPSLENIAEKTVPQTTGSTSTPAIVTRVVDGDTVIVLANGVSEKVRLIGVDTPETVDPRKLVECFGKEASAFTTATLINKNITLESDLTQSDRDKYGRLLRYVFLSDGTLVNKLIIAEGYGHEYTYDVSYKYQSEFKQAQTSANESKKGLWADGACAE